MDLKNPGEMENVELLEMYNHFVKMRFRTKKEQDYHWALGVEILKRMGQYNNNTPSHSRGGVVMQMDLPNPRYRPRNLLFLPLCQCFLCCLKGLHLLFYFLLFLR